MKTESKTEDETMKTESKTEEETMKSRVENRR